MHSASYKSLLIIALSAALAVVGSDVLIRHLSPFTQAREAIDGLRELEQADPTILVVGSSYARTFNVLGRELAAKTGGTQRMLDVPLEAGKLTSYEWMFEHRIAPLVDQRDASGALKRRSLQRLVIVTEWWDSCHVDSHTNIPGRLWNFGEFSGSVLANGLNSYNRNYLQYLWRRTFAGSALVQYRGSSALIQVAFRRILGRPRGPNHDPATVAGFYQDSISGVKCLGSTIEMNALDRLLTFANERGLEPVIILFPFMPSMQSEEARTTTYKKFFDLIAAHAQKHGARLVDLVTPSPLGDDDWLPDCEHLNPGGNAKFTEWTLAGPLAFLKESPTSKGLRVQQ
jgi:hypothetical protein